MIIAEENTLLTRLEELKSYPLKQKYPPVLINDSIRKIKSLNGADLLRETMNDKENSLIPYVTTFNPHNPEIYPELRYNKAILLRDEILKTLFSKKSFLKSKRQPPNLRKLLTKAKFSNKNETKFTVTKCKEPRCRLCNYLKEDLLLTLRESSSMLIMI